MLFFEDGDHDGKYDPAHDTLLVEAPLPPLGALGRTVVSVSLAAELAFAGAPIHALVDSRNAVVEASETNNVVSSAMPPLAPPCQVVPSFPLPEPVTCRIHSGELDFGGDVTPVICMHSPYPTCGAVRECGAAGASGSQLVG